MDKNAKGQQIEFEVFPKEHAPNYSYLSNIKGEPSVDAASIHVTFSHQSVIILLICVIMLLVASFSLGVERGKLIGKNIPSFEKMPMAALDPNIKNEKTINAATPERTEKLTVDPTMNNPSTPASLVQPPVATQKETPAPKSGYAIQVASLKTEEAAKNLTETLNKKGWSAFSKTSGKYIVVLAGDFAKREEAQIKLKELKKTYTDCFIKKI